MPRDICPADDCTRLVEPLFEVFCQTHADEVNTRLASSGVYATVAYEGLPRLCTDCVVAAYDYEPDMGEELFTFEPGTCTNCGDSRGVVWTIDSSAVF